MNLESSEQESKARNYEKVTVEAAANLAENHYKVDKRSEKPVVYFKCGKPNHVANECYSEKIICYNCGKSGFHTAKNCTAPAVKFPSQAIVSKWTWRIQKV